MNSIRVRTSRRALTGATICLLLYSVWCLQGCGEEGTKTTIPTPLESPGELIDYTECKQFPLGTTGSEIPPDQDCLIYRYDGEGMLELMHVNAGFNCCPGEITADITIEGNVITIVEDESESACRCLCLYDLEYEFAELDPGVYTIRVIEPYVAEPYASAEADPLECTIDLSANVEGNCCVDRDHYPWGTGTGIPSGSLIGYDGCKVMTYSENAEDFSDIDCIEYEYVNNNVLLMKHINAGFNCCPGKITADITVEGNVITITEHEEGAYCDCLCLFDVEYEIGDLHPGEYTIRVVELYLDEGDEPLTFTTDLTEQPLWRYCVDRNHYPWRHVDSEAEDHARLSRLKLELADIIGTPACSGDGACRSIALGAKPCGGPWLYLIYSTESTDVDLLVRNVHAYNAFNRVLNGRHSWCSDCAFVGEPLIGCRNGFCVNLNQNR